MEMVIVYGTPTTLTLLYQVCRMVISTPVILNLNDHSFLVELGVLVVKQELIFLPPK